MKEYLIRKKVIARLEEECWVSWYPYKTKFRKEIDIFGVFDIVAMKGKEAKFIQLTSYENVSARIKKVGKFLTKNKIDFKNIEVWGWNKKKHEFRIVRVSRTGLLAHMS
ncbi:MAG: hypothetical protein KGJ90_06480 [Patescibacteria group bacterium]|nr:hypothetical protein [Patescibacteria group bacterium]